MTWTRWRSTRIRHRRPVHNPGQALLRSGGRRGSARPRRGHGRQARHERNHGDHFVGSPRTATRSRIATAGSRSSNAKRSSSYVRNTWTATSSSAFRSRRPNGGERAGQADEGTVPTGAALAMMRRPPAASIALVPLVPMSASALVRGPVQEQPAILDKREPLVARIARPVRGFGDPALYRQAVPFGGWLPGSRRRGYSAWRDDGGGLPWWAAPVRWRGAALLLAKDQSWQVASILSRRAGLHEWLGDLAKMALSGTLPQPCQCRCASRGIRWADPDCRSHQTPQVFNLGSCRGSGRCRRCGTCLRRRSGA
jgi:hypothetical protein